MTTALILVDLQNDFMPGGALAVPHGNEIIPLANRLQSYFNLVVATQDWHPPDHLSFASQHAGRPIGEMIQLDGLPQVLWPEHCVQNSHGAELVASLNTSSIAKVFPKGQDRKLDSYSGFFDNGGRQETGLAAYLQERNVTDIYILGLATDYCVRATAIDSCRLGFKTFLIEDACRGVELQVGDCANAIADMERAGVHRVTSGQWLFERRASANLPGRAKSSDMIFEGRFIKLMKVGRWEYVQRRNATAVVVIVAITLDDEYVLVEQYREPVGKRSIEFPAGLVGDDVGSENEELASAVHRELIEETGFAADTITFLADSSASAGLTDETFSVYLAEGLRQVSEGGGVDGELIQMHFVPREEVAAWLARRRADGLDVAMSLHGALWLAEQFLLQRESTT